jgi:hypothetical protein
MHGYWRFSLATVSISANLLLTAAALAGPTTTAVSVTTGTPSDKPTGSVFPVSNRGGLDVNKPYGSHLKPILDSIKASTDQRTKISQIVESYRNRIQPLREEYKQKQQEFLTSMTSGGAAETIMTKQVELSHLSSEITSRYTLMRLEIRRQLSPQQILQFEAYARQQGWNKPR